MIRQVCFLFLLVSVVASFRAVAQDSTATTNHYPHSPSHSWSLTPILNVTGEDGLIVGGGPGLELFDPRRKPFACRMELVGAVGFKSGAVLLKYDALFPSLLNKLDLSISVSASQFEIRNFYGYGNASSRDSELEKADFYRVGVTQYVIHPALVFHVNNDMTLGIETAVKHFKMSQEGSRLLSRDEVESFGNDITYGGIGLTFEMDTRDDQLFPRHGFLWKAEVWNSPGMLNQPSPFQKLIGDFRYYAAGTLWNDIVLALRLKGEKVQGSYPFPESAFLGGSGSLRGYRRQRFAGDASLSGSVDLRFSLFQTEIIMPADVGFVLLADAGRVWFNRVSPAGWHTDVGGGTWVATLDRELTLSMVLASSVDGLFLNGGIGFSF